MKRQIRIAAALLACMTLLPAAVSCGNADDPASGTETSAPVSEKAAETETETADPNDRAHFKDNLPDTLDFTGKTFAMFCTSTEQSDEYFKGPDEESGEIVEDTVFRRNRAVEERLGLKLKMDAIADDGGSNVAANISKFVMAGDDTYDVFLGQTWAMADLVTSNYFVNAYDLEYIDWEQPWWNNNFMNELSIGNDYRYFLASDYFIDVLRWTRALFFNKSLYADYFDSADELYQMVFDGKWTLDRMAELSAAVYVDLNNNGVSDLEDQLGYCTYSTYSSVDPFVYATDIPFTERDGDGFVKLTLMNDKAVTLAEKLPAFFYQPGSCFGATSDEINLNKFKSGQALFAGNSALIFADELRDMTDDYGYLPYPKYDEAQDGYRSLVHDTAFIGAISTASSNLDIVGAVLEALSAESYRMLTPTWYETALKVKYSRDDISSQMIDLIHDSSMTNFIYAYHSILNGIGVLYRDLVSNNSTDYASTLQKKEAGAVKKLEEIVATFTAEG